MADFIMKKEHFCVIARIKFSLKRAIWKSHKVVPSESRWNCIGAQWPLAILTSEAKDAGNWEIVVQREEKKKQKKRNIAGTKLERRRSQRKFKTLPPGHQECMKRWRFFALKWKARNSARLLGERKRSRRNPQIVRNSYNKAHSESQNRLACTIYNRRAPLRNYQQMKGCYE